MEKTTTYEELERRVKKLEQEVFMRKQTENALRERERRLSIHLQNTPIGAISWDLNLIATEWNPAAEAIFGYSKKEAIGKHATELILHENIMEKTDAIVSDSVSKKRGFLHTNENITKDGRKIICDWYNTPILNNDGKIIGVASLVHDVTSRKHSEDVLRTSEEQNRSILDNLLVGVVVHDKDTSILLSNPEATNILGLTYEQMSGKKAIDSSWHFVHEDLTVATIDDYPVVRVISTKKPLYNYCLGIKRPDRDHITWAIINAIPVYSSDRKLNKIVVNFVNITARLEAEKALKVSLDKIKHFAYFVSHDLKNPAISIYGLTKHLNKQYGDILDERGKKYCLQILKSSEQIVSLVEMINIYMNTKEMTLNIESINLAELLLMIREEFAVPLNIRQIGWTESKHLPIIRADRIAMLRVLRNFVDNALKYGGEDLSEITIGYRENEEYHVIYVSDDGIGLTKEESQDIFELFKRQKTASGIAGSGLGLAIVKEIAEQHGGRVWSEVGSGKSITFTVSISKYL
jgi:PAS domain S-box-containing protein